jgi:outer membrane protein TolC
VCSPRRDDALAAAVASDGAIAKLNAGIAQAELFLRDVPRSSIAASAQLGTGQVADITPRGFGYDVTAGITLSLPVHARTEERALRRTLEAQIDDYRLQQDQRRLDVRAAVEQALDELSNARLQLVQAARDAQAKREELREARVRFATIASNGVTGFNDVEMKSAEAYVTQKSTTLARSQVLLAEIQLLQLAPGICSRAVTEHTAAASPLP